MPGSVDRPNPYRDPAIRAEAHTIAAAIAREQHAWQRDWLVDKLYALRHGPRTPVRPTNHCYRCRRGDPC